MKCLNAGIIIAALLGFVVPVVAKAQKPTIESLVSDQAAASVALAQEIWDLAELGYQEANSSAAMQRYLQAAGFEVEAGVAEIPTAFVAQFGAGGPTIGILAEFDALPGLSQEAVAYRKPRIEGAPGHACGHHLFGSASAAAGVALSQWIQTQGLSATLKIIGTPRRGRWVWQSLFSPCGDI